MPTPAKPEGPTCPNCHAALMRGSRQCSVCKLEVSQMAAFAAAKRAAQQKGLSVTKVEAPTGAYFKKFLRPIAIVPLIVVALLAWYLTRPAAVPAWAKLPTTPSDAVHQLLADISTGQDAGYDSAYALVAPSAKDPQADDEIGLYRQLYHVMNNYLSTEFGSDWIKQLSLEPDKVNPNTIIAHISLETLTIHTAEQTPADKLNDKNHHYAVLGIDEFDIRDAGKLQQMAGIKSILGGVAGAGATRNLDVILSAAGGGRHETAMETKLRILPNLRDPRAVTRRSVLNAWRVRNDPVIRHHLQEMLTDGRYPSDVQQTARQILDQNVPEEDLVAAGVE